jgi:hypothetical protein
MRCPSWINGISAGEAGAWKWRKFGVEIGATQHISRHVLFLSCFSDPNVTYSYIYCAIDLNLNSKFN